MQYRADLEFHVEKVEFLCSFLARNYGRKASFLVIVGEHGSGRCRALASSLQLMKMYGAYYNVVVIRDGKQTRTFTSGDTNHCDKLWILFRERADDVAITFQNQWNENKNYECLAARFRTDPTA